MDQTKEVPVFRSGLRVAKPRRYPPNRFLDLDQEQAVELMVALVAEWVSNSQEDLQEQAASVQAAVQAVVAVVRVATGCSQDRTIRTQGKRRC